jgi:hypothetical protein
MPQIAFTRKTRGRAITAPLAIPVAVAHWPDKSEIAVVTDCLKRRLEDHLGA